MKQSFAVVGNWARDGREKGISLYAWRSGNYQLEKIRSADPQVCAGALLADEQRSLLYVADEVEDPKGGGGHIRIYRIGRETGMPELLQSCASLYAKPDNLRMTKDKKFLFAVHHGTRARITKVKCGRDGEIRSLSEHGDNGTTMFRLNGDGLIEGVCDVAPSGNDSDVPSIMHSFELDPSERIAVAMDIERDVISLYRIDKIRGKMIPAGKMEDVKGHAPRYGVFHPELPLYYKNNEQHLTLDSYTYDAEKAVLNPLQTISYLAKEEGKHIKYEVSDLILSPDNANLYVSVRASNEIVRFSLDKQGHMTERETVSSEGDSPRGLCISPDGSYLYVMHDVSKNIVCKEITADGTLKETGYQVSDNCPGVMVFL